MKVAIFSTIAQHFKGADIHVRNLRWALGDVDHQIFLQSYSLHKIDIEGVTTIEVDADPCEFYFFWDEIGNHIRPLLDDFDVFLFTEQDIIFTEKVDWQVNARDIQMNLRSDYLSIYDKDKKFLYPRIWEGAIFVPASTLRDALDAGVTLGSHFSYGFPRSSEFWTTGTNINHNFCTVEEHVSERDYFDTLFEFSYYCFLNGVKYLDHSEGDCNYELGKSVVHFRAIDMMCHDCPEVYEDIGFAIEITNKKPAFKRLLNGCAVMLLLCGAHEPGDQMRQCLLNDHKDGLFWTKKKLEKLRVSCKDWMNTEEYDRFCWADRTVNKILKLS